MVNRMIGRNWILGITLLLAVALVGPSEQTAKAQSPSAPSSTAAGPSAAIRPIDSNVQPAVSRTPLPRPSEELAGNKKPDAQRSSTSAALSTMLALGMVLAVFFGLALIVKRTWPTPTNNKLPTEVLQIVGRVELQPKQYWMLMRFGNKLLLVCQQPGETRLISEVNDEDEVLRLVALCEKPHRSDAAFSGFSLQSLTGSARSITG